MDCQADLQVISGRADLPRHRQGTDGAETSDPWRQGSLEPVSYTHLIANILDVQVIGTGSVLRTAVIFFYLSNEGVSLLENAAHLGLPVPEKMKDILEQLHDRAETENSNQEDE